ncbi:MAG: TVP38/TMEM64 family protein [Thermodesulfobacteriota bacterium]
MGKGTACRWGLRLAGLVALGAAGWFARGALGERGLAGLAPTIAELGAAGPLLFVALYGLGMCLFVPGSVLTVAGAVIFGPYEGALWVWLGALLGAAGCFGLARGLGREAVGNLIGARLHGWESAVARRGFAVVALARLAWAPFTPLSFALGLTPVRFRDYLWGTALGMTPGTVALTWSVGTASLGLTREGEPEVWELALVLGAVAALTLLGVWAARRRLAAPALPEGQEGQEAPPPSAT